MEYPDLMQKIIRDKTREEVARFVPDYLTTAYNIHSIYDYFVYLTGDSSKKDDDWVFISSQGFVEHYFGLPKWMRNGMFVMPYGVLIAFVMTTLLVGSVWSVLAIILFLSYTCLLIQCYLGHRSQIKIVHHQGQTFFYVKKKALKDAMKKLEKSLK